MPDGVDRERFKMISRRVRDIKEAMGDLFKMEDAELMVRIILEGEKQDEQEGSQVE